MKHLNRWVAVAILPIALSACAGLELQHSKGLKTVDDPFFENAYAGYLDRAEHEAGYGDYAMADVYSVKARQAAAGTLPTPFNANDAGQMPGGKVTSAVLAELTPARANLAAMLAGPDRNLVPRAAAQALVMYDCWVDEESYTDDWQNAYQPDHAAYCKNGYLAAMTEIDNARPRPVAMATQPAPTPPAQMPSNYLVFFAWNSATLTAQSHDVIRQVATNAESDSIDRLMAVGHADSSGAATYNVGLSERRADAVRAALIAAGVPDANVGIDWKGETEPLVLTNNGVREPQNRRVEITFQR
jgi:OOP family OmpA-OmpF porin